MIYISQGFEGGIGLEIFIKSWQTLSSFEQSQIILYTSAQDLSLTLDSMNVSYKVEKASCRILESNLKCRFLNKTDLPNSTQSLLEIFNDIRPEDILITLPSRKSEFVHNNQNFNGHTEFFRNYFNNKDIVMCFKGSEFNTLLLTDHIPLKDVSHNIETEKFQTKIDIALDGFKKYFIKIDSLIFAGLNPHVGENGMLGSEDDYIINLAKGYRNSIGPVSGDIVHQHLDSKKEQLLIYAYHDQGLAPFKIIHGFIGVNISFGLPFIRLSVDHGTAENIFGNNVANYSSQVYVLKIALKIDKKKPSLK